MLYKNILILFIFCISLFKINAQTCGVFDLQFSIKFSGSKHPHKIKVKDFEHPRFNSPISSWVNSKNKCVEIHWHSSLGNPSINSEIFQSFRTLKNFTILISVIIDGEEYFIEKEITSADYTITTYVDEFPNKINLIIEPFALDFLNL